MMMWHINIVYETLYIFFPYFCHLSFMIIINIYIKNNFFKFIIYILCDTLFFSNLKKCPKCPTRKSSWLSGPFQNMNSQLVYIEVEGHYVGTSKTPP